MNENTLFMVVYIIVKHWPQSNPVCFLDCSICPGSMKFVSSLLKVFLRYRTSGKNGIGGFAKKHSICEIMVPDFLAAHDF